MEKIIISEEEMTEDGETYFPLKVVYDGKRIAAEIYADEIFVEFDTPKGKDAKSLKVIIDELKRNAKEG